MADRLTLSQTVGWGTDFAHKLLSPHPLIFRPSDFPGVQLVTPLICSRNNIGQKCEGNCGLWVLNEIIKRMYPESLKKIVEAVWDLPAK